MNLVLAKRKKIKREDILILCRYLHELKTYKNILNREDFNTLPLDIQQSYAIYFQDTYLKYSISLQEFFKEYFNNPNINIGYFIFDLKNEYILYQYEGD